jgi:hypothetical protein
MNDDTTSVTAALFGLVGFAAREPGPAGLQVGVRAGRVGGCGGVTDGGRSARLRPPRRDRRRRRRPTALKSVLHDWQDEPAIEILRARRRAAGTTGTALLVIERQFALPAAKLSNLNRWTRGSTVSGLLDVVHDQGDPSTRRYRLPTEVVKIMTDAQASATSRLSSRPGPRRREQRAARRSDISESVKHQPMSGR